MNKRPLSVTIISWLYIATGAIGFVHAFTELKGWQPREYDFFLVELVRVVAVVCGVFMLRGHNWARWVALLWIVYHVVLSGFHSVPQLAFHSVLCAVFAYFLFRSEATRYFHAT